MSNPSGPHGQSDDPREDARVRVARRIYADTNIPIAGRDRDAIIHDYGRLASALDMLLRYVDDPGDRRSLTGGGESR